MKGSFKLPVPPAGAADGREVELSVDSGYVVWRYVGDVAWTQLVSLDTLTGADGAPGDDGLSAYEVAVANGFVGTEAEWLTSLKGEPGNDGTEIELSVHSGYVVWRYVGDVSWTNLYQIPSYNGYIGITIDGSGSVISTGEKASVQVPFASTIVSWTILADVSGSIVIDVWKDSFANYPPTAADSITASAKPTLSNSVKGSDSTLTGWTKSISAGDVLKFNVMSASTVTRVVLMINVLKS